MLRGMENTQKSTPKSTPKSTLKSTVAEIKARFDADVERFSQLETGQVATMDAALCLEMIATTAMAVTPNIQNVLDIGCGAGNYTLKLLQKTAPATFDVTLLDLSQNMLDRAEKRVREVSDRAINTVAKDIREWDVGEAQFDVILAAAVFHHLRTDADWESVFAKLYRALRPGGALWIFDLITHDAHPAIHTTQWERYGEYLVALKDAHYRNAVFAYIEKEDTPKPLLYQTDLLRRVGFQSVDVLHKNGPFAAFGGVK
jgi:tRNA (cmo5U34)-methyltransferase